MVKVLPPLKPDIPEPPPGQTWHIAPAGHFLWLEDPEYFDQMGRDPLQRARLWSLASSDQRVKKLGEILEQYPKQKHRRLMLFEAAKRGDAALVLCLVQTGLTVHPNDLEANEEEKDAAETKEGGQSGGWNNTDVDDPILWPVHIAASLGHRDCVRIFIEEAEVEVDIRDNFGRTPLMVAHGHLEVVRYLLTQGAEPKMRAIAPNEIHEKPAKPSTGPNAMDHAAAVGNSGVLELLLDHPSVKSTKEWLTPFSIQCAARGGIKCLRLLLERGEYPMENGVGAIKDEVLSEEQRQTITDAIPAAAHEGDLESLKLLLSYKVSTDENGNLTPFEVSENWHKQFIYGLYDAMATNRPEKFEFLNGLGLKEHETMSLDRLPEAQNINIQRLLEKAIEAGSIDCAKLLIEKHAANPDRHRIPPALRPLFIGSLRNKTEMLQHLLDNHEIDIHFGNGRYATGPTALWGAINLKALNTIALLLQRGGPVDRIDEELRNLSAPSTAILRATFPSPGYRPMIFLETEEHAREYVEGARLVWQNLNPLYVRLELDLEDKEWLSAIQLRKKNEELRETGPGARALSAEDATDEDLDQDVRNLLPPMPTLMDRESRLKNDDDLIPEFKPFASVPGF
ncbi:ankyrin repeat-containing domain protein [Xylaria venustula]|nr:ankyrin repeat-containing domain protein [Xylaria venustula]